ncbi:hypothetical protein BGM19_23940 [Streptomyces agglomeratus]|uniref:Secreted protein n=1 Tax=Streptomyces agglomeratus TaxID=285458 RepID=A0A1E5P6S8_9ACTN|nr:hypothetical protein [Streptomyces agglomeratus]OEJ25251.1 hypothetical protein AS594_12870 [Streptomyces agglomeratus]OEJ53260.1 hypothetical protein BGK72_23230 [Streptomyces agglomeratus]OEJ60597.1 hypothetical protein BGM19_23940 [Streptomyces agglomeratus]
MSMRHTMKARRALTAVAITTGLVLTVAGCGGDGGDGKSNDGSSSSTPTGKGSEGGEEPTESESQPPAADTVLAEVTGGDDNTTLIINSAVRDQGGFLTVNGKLRNGKGGSWVPNSWRGDEKELSGNGSSMAGASLVDRVGKKKYLILRDTDGRCLCTQFSGAFKENEEKSWFAQFPAPPADTTKVDFQIADMPVASIEISDGE